MPSPQDVQEQNQHHPNASEYLRAVASRCFICFAVWDHASAKFKAAYGTGWELAMTYRLYLPQDEPESVRLVISHQSRLLQNDHYMVFRLVRAKGKLIVIRLLLM